MALEDITPRIAILMALGFAITVLVIMGGNTLWHHNFKDSFLFLSLAAILTAIFFRKRMFALSIVFFAFLLVNAGLTAIFHPTVPGVLVATGSIVCLVFLSKLHWRRHPNALRADWKQLFENKPNFRDN